MNNLQSRLYTPNFSKSDRSALWKALGLTSLDFNFFEITSEQVLTSLKIESGVAQVQLEPRAITEISDAGQAILIKRRRTHSLLPLKPTHSDLWYELMPFPLNRLSYFFQGGREEATLQFSNETLENDLKALWGAFRNMEERLSTSELGLLWVKNGEQRFALLLHHVRRRRIRMGTSSLLCDMGRKYDEGLLDVDGMRQAFGTFVDWVTLDVPSSGRLSDLISSIGQALSNAVLPMGVPGCASPQPEIQL